MSAICGLFGMLDHERAPCAFDRLVQSIGDRGRGHPARFVEDGRVMLGARARRAEDQSTVYRNPSGTLFMVCDGTVFNGEEVSSWLQGRGRTPSTGDARELLLHLYEMEGLEGLKRADGQFAFAIWDKTKERLLLGRDFLGVHPLYYANTPSGFAFASQLRCLLSSGVASSTLDAAGVSLYLTFLTVPGPRTLVSGVHRLLPGHVAWIDKSGSITLQRYWDLLDDPIPERDDESFYVNRARELHQGALERRMVDGPMGALLSGGNDSSANAALMARLNRGPLHTFTVGLEDVEGQPAYSDLEYARKVAELIKSQHHERLLSTDEFLKTIGAVTDALDDVVSEPSSIFLYHALRMAHDEKLDVVVTGEANDEISCGHGEMIRIRDGYYQRWEKYMRLPGPLRKLAALAAPYVSPKRIDVLQRAARNEAYFWNYEIAFPESEHETILTPLAQAGINGETAVSVVERYRGRVKGSEHGSRDYLNYMIYMMMQDFYFGNLMLGKLDLLAAQLGLEARCPYAEHRYSHFVFNIPAKYKAKNGMVKYFFKRAIEGVLPHEIIYRPKQGFRTPVVELFQGRLGDWARPHLLEEGVTRAGFVRREEIESLLRTHREGGADLSNKLWTLMALNLWYERFMVSGKGEQTSAPEIGTNQVGASVSQ